MSFLVKRLLPVFSGIFFWHSGSPKHSLFKKYVEFFRWWILKQDITSHMPIWYCRFRAGWIWLAGFLCILFRSFCGSFCFRIRENRNNTPTGFKASSNGADKFYQIRNRKGKHGLKCRAFESKEGNQVIQWHFTKSERDYHHQIALLFSDWIVCFWSTWTFCTAWDWF